MLSSAQKKSLLLHARNAIAASWDEEIAARVNPPDLSEVSACFAGVFVSLHLGKKLRGCIGHLGPASPLAQLITEMARAAAHHDPRFPPLRPEELPQVRIEISLLFPLERLNSADEICIGRHGLMVRLGTHHGLLLPQVATQRRWDARTFLEHACRKADLPPEAWQDPEAEVLRFRAEVFSDDAIN